MTSRSSFRFRSLRLAVAAAALAMVSVSPSLAQVTFAQYDQTNVSIQQWTVSEATVPGVTTTTIAATGAAQFTFSGVAGVPFTGAEPAIFTLNATSTQSGQCNTATCANGNSYDQAGYSGTFSFIDAGSDPGVNLLSGTFVITGIPSQTGASFGSQVGANGGTFGASTDTTNAFQVVFTSAFLSFANETSETASWSLSSLKDLLVGNGFATTATTNSQAYPSQTFSASGGGTFSSSIAPAAAGSIQIVKNTVGGNGTFAFTSNFGLSSLTTSGGTANKTFSGLTAGSSFSVSETVPPGWIQTSAVCTNGTPAAVTVVSGVTTICTFTNTIIPATGSIQVVKNTVGGNGTFAFTSNFGLSSLTTIGATANQTFSNLNAGGSYNVSETVPSGWTQTSATCTNGTPAAVTVISGAMTICTFTNTKAAATGSIQVVKNTVGGNGTFAFTSNFGLTSLTTIGATANQTFSNLNAGGSYGVSETVPSGWTQTSAVCTNGTPAAVTVVGGATTTCTFTNTKAAATGSIQVVKNTVGGNGTFAFTSNFGLTSLTTIGATANQTFSNLNAGGSYGVSETVPSGWTQTSAVCTNGTPAAVTVVGGATTTCTFTNTKAAATGSIQVVKNTVGGNGTFAFTSNFGLTSLTTSGATANQTFGGLTAGGSYNVSETVPSGWTQTSAICSNGTPAAVTVVSGATTICTFINTKVAATGSIQVVKNTVGGNGTFAFTSNFGLTSLTTSGATANQTFSGLTAAGSYNVSETVPSGWTQTSATCTNGTPAAVTVVSGATTICTFINTQAVALVPDLIISKSHVGTFRQGDTGDTYTLTASNTGPVPTTGVVTVSDILPAGLTATAISGTGWICTPTPLACTRSDALAAGASYPVITVTVNVAGSGLAFSQTSGSPVF